MSEKRYPGCCTHGNTHFVCGIFMCVCCMCAFTRTCAQTISVIRPGSCCCVRGNYSMQLSEALMESFRLTGSTVRSLDSAPFFNKNSLWFLFALFSLLNAPVSQHPGKIWRLVSEEKQTKRTRKELNVPNLADLCCAPIIAFLKKCFLSCRERKPSLWRWGRPALSARCVWLMWDRAGWDDGFPSQTTNSQLCVYCKWSGPQPVCDVSAVVAER